MTGRLLYVDCVGGVAGDMLLAALLDAGADEGFVRDGLARLGVPGLDLQIGRTERHGIGCATLAVVAPDEHVHRRLADVQALIDGAQLPERAAARAHETFRRLADAEARIHGTTASEVQFHEVGAIDALADVCGTCLALESLDVERVVASPLPASRGFVRAAHGRLPLPAPAVLELLRGVPVVPLEVGRELVTPTGAALLVAIAESFGDIPPMLIGPVGYGAGARDLEQVPNLVRVILAEAASAARPAPLVTLIETNLDDLSPELVPDAAEAAFAAGALDVWTTPAGMKKGRPGVVLAALARPADERRVALALVRETSALGVRIGRMERLELDRDHVTVHVGGLPVRVKRGLLDGRVVNVAPEHDDCAAAAATLGEPVKRIWAAALAAAGDGIGASRGD